VVTSFAVTIYGRCFFHLVFRMLIANIFKIPTSHFFEINGFAFLNFTRFSLKVHDNHKTSITANSNHNFLFSGYYELSKQTFECRARLFLLQNTIPHTLSKIRAKSFTSN
jgi:hypothetical protein